MAKRKAARKPTPAKKKAAGTKKKVAAKKPAKKKSAPAKKKKKAAKKKKVSAKAAPAGTKKKKKSKRKAAPKATGKPGGQVVAAAGKPSKPQKPPAQKKLPATPTAAPFPKPAVSAAPKISPSVPKAIQLPSTFLDSDHLPLWFGGFGLSDCFRKLQVTTVGELRTKTEEEIREICGTRDLVRLKARIEHFEEKVFASELEPPVEDTLWPAHENFAYFVRVDEDAPDDDEHAARSLCEIIHRPDSESVTIRRGIRVGGQWHDETIPFDRLELVSRQHRREQLERLPPLELAHLVSGYHLTLESDDDRVAKLLHYEFSEFAKTW